MHGGVLSTAYFKSCPEDFKVDEILDIDPFGEGEHRWLLVAKRDQNTAWVAGLLAKLAGIRRLDVGFSGLKDRFAVTSQWFSLYMPGREIDMESLEHNDFCIIKSFRHNKKLRRGMHQGNSFCIVLREFMVGEKQLRERLKQISTVGLPNYFGEQRFGINGNNLIVADKLVKADKLKGNRQGTAIYLSAARSWLFNLILAEHVKNFNKAKINLGLETGALWGRGRPVASDQVNIVETSILSDWTDWCYALEHAGLKQQRRSLLVRPENLVCKEIYEGKWEISFSLAGGCFATALLREIAELSRQ